MARGPRRVRRTVSPHRKTTVKYGQTYSKRVRPIKSTGPKKVRKAGQVYRPVKDVAAGIHGASYGVYRQPATRERQQRFRNLTVKAAKILGYPQSTVAKKMTPQGKIGWRTAHSLGTHIRQYKHFGTMSTKSKQGFTDYEKLALAIASGQDSEMIRALDDKK